jgi:hypothetical protein
LFYGRHNTIILCWDKDTIISHFFCCFQIKKVICQACFYWEDGHDKIRNYDMIM